MLPVALTGASAIAPWSRRPAQMFLEHGKSIKADNGRNPKEIRHCKTALAALEPRHKALMLPEMFCKLGLFHLRMLALSLNDLGEMLTVQRIGNRRMHFAFHKAKKAIGPVGNYRLTFGYPASAYFGKPAMH